MRRRANILKTIASALILTTFFNRITYSQGTGAHEESGAFVPHGAKTTGVVSVLDYGADPTGTKDSTEAFASAAKSASQLFAPCGTYQVNWVVNSKSNFDFEGAGECTVLTPTISGTPVVSINGGNFAAYRNFSAINRGNKAGSGINVFSAANTKFTNLYVFGFTGNGLECNGDSKSSGVDVVGGYYLGNGEAGVYYNDCQDFRIEGIQAGNNNGYGILLLNSNAGQLRNNFIWHNGIAISGNEIKYDWISQNRVTQSQKQGFICTSCSFLTVSENQSYENSKSSTGKYEDWKFSAVNNLIFTNNQSFDWTGKAHTNYGVTLDSASSNVIMENNIFSNHTMASAEISSAAPNVRYTNNFPQKDVSVNSCIGASSTFTGSSGHTRVGGQRTTVFLGGSVTSNERIAAIPVAGEYNICLFKVVIDQAPGLGQIRTLTLRKNELNTELTGTISGSLSFAVTVQAPLNAVSVTSEDTIDIKMVSSTGAASTAVRYTIALAPR